MTDSQETEIRLSSEDALAFDALAQLTVACDTQLGELIRQYELRKDALLQEARAIQQAEQALVARFAAKYLSSRRNEDWKFDPVTRAFRR